MSSSKKVPELLVGDNPFHGISHLDQVRAKKNRDSKVMQSDYASNLVKTALDSGASGFMFSVSETTLGVLKSLRGDGTTPPFTTANSKSLWPIAPYAYEYVRYAVEAGMTGLALRFVKQLIRSFDIGAIASALSGFNSSDVNKLVESLFRYEFARVKSAAGKGARIETLMMHEVLADMGIALGLENLFTSYIDFISNKKVMPGFETRNFAFLVAKFKEWNIDFSRITIATPFNKLGYQMSPSREKCESALASLESSNVIAMSILASGYLKLNEALDYVTTLPALRGIVVGVSNENQARETFLTASSSSRLSPEERPMLAPK